MNPITFSEILTDIPDSFIESAAEPHSKPIRWYQISAAAACIVLLIAAAVYPKLRIQTSEITEPPAAIVTTETTAQNTAETTAVTVYTTAVSQKATHRTTAESSGVTAERDTPTQTYTITEDEPDQTDAAVVTDPPKTDISITATAVAIETTALTEQHIETTDNSDIPVIIEEPTIEIPLWKGMVEYPESVSKPHLYSRFFRGTGDMDAWMRTLYGIPQDYDLTQKHCLLVEIDTAYSNAVIIGCKPVPNGLTLIVAYLDDGKELNKTIHYAMPIPDNMTLEPDNCNADYLEMTNEELIQEMEKDKLKLKTGNEQEGLQ